MSHNSSNNGLNHGQDHDPYAQLAFLSGNSNHDELFYSLGEPLANPYLMNGTFGNMSMPDMTAVGKLVFSYNSINDA